ncbi:MAG: Glycoside hydrolase family 57 [Candidatus Collierbacteria bacterium GW2011_GWF2_42_51]|nr:MAG: Glycoside hydrolase family 57 [Candidatus Collierbacteria bacterium GW2011_GWF2_42_51]
MKENGIGEAFIHPILPDLSLSDKSIVISAGVGRFKDITGVNPKIFWPPETAIDTETLNVLIDNGYEGFVCAPEQIIQANGSASDNQPTISL